MVETDPIVSRCLRYLSLIQKGINPFGDIPFDMGIAYEDAVMLDFIWGQQMTRERKDMKNLEKASRNPTHAPRMPRGRI